jgi:hypothetical protein
LSYEVYWERVSCPGCCGHNNNAKKKKKKAVQTEKKLMSNFLQMLSFPGIHTQILASL